MNETLLQIICLFSIYFWLSILIKIIHDNNNYGAWFVFNLFKLFFLV